LGKLDSENVRCVMAPEWKYKPTTKTGSHAEATLKIQCAIRVIIVQESDLLNYQNERFRNKKKE
jgi:hypothetical protein